VSARFTDLLTVAVLAFVGFRLVSGLRQSLATRGRSVIYNIVRGIGWRHVWPVPIVLTIVITAAALLMQIPGFDWGWWSALGGQGNPVFGSSDSTAGTIWSWLIPAVFLLLLFPALPLFAYAEEVMFRKGAEHWNLPTRAFKVVLFGLTHALIGIPIGTALALGFGGWYFMIVYLRAYRQMPIAGLATLESARAHTVYNAVIVSIVALAIVLIALQ
jgi:hypothetical protein